MIDGRLAAHRVKEATTSAQNSRRDGKKGDSNIYLLLLCVRRRRATAWCESRVGDCVVCEKELLAEPKC